MVEIIRLCEFKLPPPVEKHFRRNTSFRFHEYEIEEVYWLQSFAGLDMAGVFSVLPPDAVHKRIESPPFGGLKLTVWRSVTPEVFQEELRYVSLPGVVGTVTVML